MGFHFAAARPGKLDALCPVKCNMMKKQTDKIQTSYTLRGTVLEDVESIKYLGVTINSNICRCLII